MPRLGMCSATLLRDPLDTSATELLEVLDAIAAAGFESLSWWAMHGSILGDGATDAIRSRGLTVGALEVAASWAGGNDTAIERELAFLAPVADEFGPEVMVSVSLDPVVDDQPAAAGLRQVTEWAEARHMRVALEFLPWTGVASIHDAHRLCELVDHPACGLLLDTWHWARQPTGSDLSQLDDIDLTRTTYIQLDDAPRQPVLDELFAETMAHRLAPGDGEVDLAGLLDAVRASGADPYIAPEVFNAEMLEGGSAAMAAYMHETTMRALDRVGWAPSDP
ncbi:MAG: sugar phosphate isomerase/epimerase family protein [Acidimicrobiales bacterium]